MQASYTWMDDVRMKLISIEEWSTEDRTRILYFLDKKDDMYRNNPNRPYAAQWDSLRITLVDENAFKSYASHLLMESKQGEMENNFKKDVTGLYTEMQKPSTSTVIERHQGLDVTYLKYPSWAKAFSLSNLASLWDALPVKYKTAVVDTIRRVAGRAGPSYAILLRNPAATGTVLVVGVQLGYRVYQHIKRWWNGGLDGKWCAKYVIDDTAATVVGAAGVVGGAAALGSLVGPWGAAIGYVLGTIVTGLAADALIERITKHIFGLPNSEAASKAYEYLGVPATASNSEVNSAYINLCLRHDPNRGGDIEKLFTLQIHMSIIRQDRGEF